MDSLHLLDGQAVNPPSANGADLMASLLALGKRARKASRVLSLASPEQKNRALRPGHGAGAHKKSRGVGAGPAVAR
jgi:hypothetical protein